MEPNEKELASSYVVQDRRNAEELERLVVQDQFVTAVMGGVLSEQSDPARFQRVLDVGSGSGGWALALAQAYPTTSVFGIDISTLMVHYAREQALAQQLSDRVTFQVMDALSHLQFPDRYFDLVNMRFGVSFLRTWDWLKILREMRRVCRLTGIIRITENEVGLIESTSPALMQLFAQLQCAFYRSGHLFEQSRTGLIDRLVPLLTQQGFQAIQTKSYTVFYRAGTEAGAGFCKDWQAGFRTLRPFMVRWGCLSPAYDSLYEQALQEMAQPDFSATSGMLTICAEMPGSYRGAVGAGLS